MCTKAAMLFLPPPWPAEGICSSLLCSSTDPSCTSCHGAGPINSGVGVKHPACVNLGDAAGEQQGEGAEFVAPCSGLRGEAGGCPRGGEDVLGDREDVSGDGALGDGVDALGVREDVLGDGEDVLGDGALGDGEDVLWMRGLP